MFDAMKLSASVCAAPAPKSALPFSPLSFHLYELQEGKNASAKPDNFSSPVAGSRIANFNEELPQLRMRTSFDIGTLFLIEVNKNPFKRTEYKSI